jgi:REP element-mobilizing transposase RayT
MFDKELYQEKYRIKSIRLPYWDYSNPGYYFVTTCIKYKECVLGNIVNDKMILNENGYIVKQCWRDLPKHYGNCKLDSLIIMPNHVHGIIQICYSNVEAGLKPINIYFNSNVEAGLKPASTGKRHPLSEIIRGFKTFSSRKINLNNSNIDFKWQKSYYDHIVRDEDDLNRIRNYIQNNPFKWGLDRNNLK